MICKRVSAFDWPDKELVIKWHTHKLGNLLDYAKLVVDLKAATAANPVLENNWQITLDWSELSRYARHTEAEARELVEAVGNPKDGVLQWVEARW